MSSATQKNYTHSPEISVMELSSSSTSPMNYTSFLSSSTTEKNYTYSSEIYIHFSHESSATQMNYTHLPEIPVMTPFSSSATQKNYTYDIFLSFRGEDTRKNFVDHLYAALDRQGIHTFKDNERLEKGKRINEDLLKSIEESKFYIIIFSKNYASSSWCLDELVKIMECQKATEQIAYPVFYDVDPSEVRKQLGPVGEAISRHNNKPEIGKWRLALIEAANLAGWDLRNTDDGHEAKLIKKIVDHISFALHFDNVKDDERLVGVESRIEDIVKSLEMGVKDVRMIGIKGIGGGGKTTLARAVFDKICFSFEVKSFIENVREVSTPSMSGLRLLQQQVLSSVSNERSFTIWSAHEGKDLMKKWLFNKKVILVLDDVDHLDQLDALAGGLNWFGPGSRIIITTRDEQVLVAHRVKLIHHVRLLSQEEAMCLFRRYAFGSVIPNHTYNELSLKVVHYAAGLPLTIKVLGSFLCGKDKLEWEDAIERLRTIPLKETLEKLELSFTGLEDDYKEIFLNVACFLKDWPKEAAIRALESCGFHARNGLRVLEQKSLITIRPAILSMGERLGMHDHIQEMGLNIVRGSHPDDSRLLIWREIEHVLANHCVRYDRLYASTVSKNSVVPDFDLVRMRFAYKVEKNHQYSVFLTQVSFASPYNMHGVLRVMITYEMGHLFSKIFTKDFDDTSCHPKNCVGLKVLQYTRELRTEFMYVCSPPTRYIL